MRAATEPSRYVVVHIQITPQHPAHCACTASVVMTLTAAEPERGGLQLGCCMLHALSSRISTRCRHQRFDGAGGGAAAALCCGEGWQKLSRPSEGVSRAAPLSEYPLPRYDGRCLRWSSASSREDAARAAHTEHARAFAPLTPRPPASRRASVWRPRAACPPAALPSLPAGAVGR